MTDRNWLVVSTVLILFEFITIVVIILFVENPVSETGTFAARVSRAVINHKRRPKTNITCGIINNEDKSKRRNTDTKLKDAYILQVNNYPRAI